MRISKAVDMIMLFKGNSSRLEHLIEKIQANKENHDGIAEDIKGWSTRLVKTTNL